jgi:hypothetical protein
LACLRAATKVISVALVTCTRRFWDGKKDWLNFFSCVLPLRRKLASILYFLTDRRYRDGARARRDVISGVGFEVAAYLMAKSSRFLPFLISAASHLGIAPRPAHVSEGSSDCGTWGRAIYPSVNSPLGRPGASLPEDTQPPALSAASCLCNRPTLLLRIWPISLRIFKRASTDIESRFDGRAISNSPWQGKRPYIGVKVVTQPRHNVKIIFQHHQQIESEWSVQQEGRVKRLLSLVSQFVN